MRPTGSLHLGHYHSVLKNWVRLQSEYPCFFSVVDWHALRTTYGTRLAVANVPLALAQKLMRHCDPRLTANVYTVAQLSDLAREVEKLRG